MIALAAAAVLAGSDAAFAGSDAAFAGSDGTLVRRCHFVELIEDGGRRPSANNGYCALSEGEAALRVRASIAAAVVTTVCFDVVCTPVV